ncbi:carboxymuconolactone decarboxylase family protein [Thiolapillus sp.]
MTSNVLINPEIPESDRERVKRILKGVERRLGFVPAGLRLYAISPPVLEQFVNLVGYYMEHPRLNIKLMALIRYLVSSAAGCRFCIDFNAAFLMEMGVTPEELEAAREDVGRAPVDDADKTLLKIALDAIDRPDDISGAELDMAREKGFSDRDIFDAVIIAANNKAFTQVLRTFKVEDQGAFA